VPSGRRSRLRGSSTYGARQRRRDAPCC
jgi:hypothetical protein